MWDGVVFVELRTCGCRFRFGSEGGCVMLSVLGGVR